MDGRKHTYRKSLAESMEQLLSAAQTYARLYRQAFFAPFFPVQFAQVGPGGPYRPVRRSSYRGVPLNGTPPPTSVPPRPPVTPPHSSQYPFPQPMPTRPPVVRGSYRSAPVKAGKTSSKWVWILLTVVLALVLGRPVLRGFFRLLGFMFSHIMGLLLVFLAIIIALIVLVIYATKHDPHKDASSATSSSSTVYTQSQPMRQTVPQPSVTSAPPQPTVPVEKPTRAQKIAPFPRSGDPETDKIIAEGEKYMQQLRQADVDIPDEQVSACIVRMEASGRKIFEFIAENPEKAPQIHKFMSYYLPTTLKLLKTYDKFGRQGVKGENISSTMYDIEGMMETIATAFDKQLDSLFESEALDVSTDMTVLETMLRQEGLTEDELRKK